MSVKPEPGSLYYDVHVDLPQSDVSILRWLHGRATQLHDPGGEGTCARDWNECQCSEACNLRIADDAVRRIEAEL